MPIGRRLGALRDSLGSRSPGPAEPAPALHSPARVITVLGMHRSGTSSLVGSLEAAGLVLGDVQTRAAKSNEKGHREPNELIALHEDVLITNGGAWHLPPAQTHWSGAQRRRRDEFIASRAGLPLWGWKEPRTLLVLDGWLEALPELELVATFRHPAVVARSLQRRHGSESADMWLDLWLAYNACLLELLDRQHVSLIDFDLPDDAYRARLRAVVEELRLPRVAAAESFFDGELRTSQKQPPTGVELPTEVQRIYDRLREIAAAQA